MTTPGKLPGGVQACVVLLVVVRTRMLRPGGCREAGPRDEGLKKLAQLE